MLGPWCMSMSMVYVHVHGVCPCPWCMSMSMVYVHVHAACSGKCCMSISMLHIHVHATCPFMQHVHAYCTCCMSMSILLSISMNMHMEHGHGTQTWKKTFITHSFQFKIPAKKNHDSVKISGSARLCHVCLPVWCLLNCMTSAYLYGVWPCDFSNTDFENIKHLKISRKAKAIDQ